MKRIVIFLAFLGFVIWLKEPVHLIGPGGDWMEFERIEVNRTMDYWVDDNFIRLKWPVTKKYIWVPMCNIKFWEQTDE